MAHPSYPPPKPPVSGSGLAIERRASCSVDEAVTAVGTALLVAFVIGVVGLIVTMTQLFRRKLGWPFAVGTLALCTLAVFLEGVGYSMAVGA